MNINSIRINFTNQRNNCLQSSSQPIANYNENRKFSNIIILKRNISNWNKNVPNRHNNVKNTRKTQRKKTTKTIATTSINAGKNHNIGILNPKRYLKISKKISTFLQPTNAHCDINSLFQFNKVIGDGITGKVYKAMYKKNIIALKAIKRSMRHSEYFFTQEAKLLMYLDHPNIIKLEEVFLDKQYYYMVLEMGQSDLANYRQYHKFNEIELKCVMRQLLSAVVYLHSKNICHRDIKPENIVYSRKAKNHPIIIDFGTAIRVKDNKMYDELVGTPSYLSPERCQVHNGEQLKKSDIWAIGIICYELIVGKHCFDGKDKMSIFTKIQKNEWKWPDNIQISPKCAHFVQKCLTYDWRERPSAVEALDHFWFYDNSGGNSSNQ